MNKSLYLLVLSFIWLQLPAQVHKCFTDQAYVHYRNQQVNYEQVYRQNEMAVREWIKNNSESIHSQKGNAVVTIPVVFHVVYKNSAQNIADNHIFDQVDILNECFRLQNSNFPQTRPIFDSIAADVEIEFCLATVDPTGNPSNGITHTQAPTSAVFNPLFGMDNVKSSATGGKDAWPNDQYLNIWVCDMSFLGLTVVLGYATFPGGDPLKDGVVIQYQFIGYQVNQTTSDKGRTTVHEVGHWLGLRHIWGDGQLSSPLCDSTDYVDDTPNADTASQQTCLIKNSCINESSYWTNIGIDPPDMIENYMDYSYDDCMTMFSQGQKTRMLGFLNTVRTGLLTSPGCSPTGLLENPTQTVSLFPNPVTDQLTIQLTVPGEFAIHISDLSGRLVKSLEVFNTVTEINVGDLPSGMYLFEVVQNHAVVQAGKLVKGS